MDKQTIRPTTVWDPAEQLFAQAVAVTGVQQTLYLAGQTAIDADGSIVGVSDAEQQIRMSFANIAAIVSAAGGSLDNVVKLTVYLVDIGMLETYTRVLGEVFPIIRPAQTVVGVTALALPELLVELDAVAVL